MTVELRPGQAFAGYRIEAVAGRGGMGVVYRATQIGRGRTVALKLIAPELAADEAFRERLQVESELLASIDHPNVIAFYEAGEADGQLFMSMRYVEGMDLRSLIAERGWLAPERAARIVAQVAAGLDAAHASGLVHRDVKPANVLIERRDGTQRAYLSDFGLTKRMALTTAITRSGHWVGTLDYVAPEQIEGRRVDARADVYALGCVLFQALTGRVAYVRESDAAKLWAHLHDAPPSACQLRPGLPAEVDRVIARAMAKDPARRYPSAGDLARAAIAAAGGEALTEPGHSVATGAAAPAAPDGAGDQRTDGGGAPRDRRRLRRPVVAGTGAALLVAAALAAVALTNRRDSGRGARRVATDRPRVEHISLGRRAVPGNIAADATDAYVLDRSARAVVRVGKISGQIEGRVKVGRAPADIAVDPLDRRLWVVNRGDQTVSEIDTGGGRVGRPFRVQREPAYLAVLPDEVVILSQRRDGASLLRVDKKTHRRIGRTVENHGYATDLAAGGAGVLATTAFPPIVDRYSAQLEHVAGSRLNQDGVPAELAIDGQVAWVVFSVSALFPSKLPVGTVLPGVVLRIDISTGKRIGKPIKVGRAPTGIALDQGVVWVPSTKDESVTRIDERSGRVIGKPIKVGPTNGAVAASGGVAWVGGAKDVIKITPP